MIIPEYPEFLAISEEMRPEMYPSLNLIRDGISEFTFSNLFLFRHTYNYRVSRISGSTLVISGERNGLRFFEFPCGVPSREHIDDLFRSHDYLKNLSETNTLKYRIELEQWGYEAVEDRDNFDYLYLREDLAKLEGKDYHKKRNLVNAFINSYTYEEKPMTEDNVSDAFGILDGWRDAKGFEGDYRAAHEALELFKRLSMRGSVYYVDGKPAGWVLGESLAKGRMFAVHFEKALDEYKGIYQFMNQAFAMALPRYYLHVNREQDLGDPGLRQAKMTYRPSGFVKKYKILKASPEAASSHRET